MRDMVMNVLPATVILMDSLCVYPYLSAHSFSSGVAMALILTLAIMAMLTYRVRTAAMLPATKIMFMYAPAAGVNGSCGCHPLYHTAGASSTAARVVSPHLTPPCESKKRTQTARRSLSIARLMPPVSYKNKLVSIGK